jgi:cytochrome c peroxidase
VKQRLSADNTVACATCHRPDHAFLEPTAVSTGIGGQKDEGRFVVTKKDADRGAFKTPTLRDVTRHPPYQHDGSVSTLREVVELYNRGGHKNPYLDVRMEPLGLSPTEVDAIVAFLETLEGQGYQDKAPQAFPQ